MSLADTISPQAVWFWFERINAIPRASNKEEALALYLQKELKQRGIQTFRDQIGNVIATKAAQNCQSQEPVLLQAHLDMVHQKNNDTDFDFDTQGIEMWVDGDWLKAKGTTLGADNGLGLAMILAVLTDTEMVHPPIEALFTLNEESGMTGAKGLEGGIFKAKRMLNLDTEDDAEITIGCAGGIDTLVKHEYQLENLADGYAGVEILVKGLQGGHSGMDIILQAGNANKILFHLLHGLSAYGIRITEIDGGGLRNAIPREAKALLAVPQDLVSELKEKTQELLQQQFSLYQTTDPGLVVEVNQLTEAPSEALSSEDQKQLIAIIRAVPNGVYRMHPVIEQLVETSSNLARVQLAGGALEIQSLQRSSSEVAKMEIAESIADLFKTIGAEIQFANAYPGWNPNPEADLLAVAKALHLKFFKREPKVSVIHAGLECGIILGHYPEMETISIGPLILGAHSPDERASISSSRVFWDFLKELLRELANN